MDALITAPARALAAVTSLAYRSGLACVMTRRRLGEGELPCRREAGYRLVASVCSRLRSTGELTETAVALERMLFT